MRFFKRKDDGADVARPKTVVKGDVVYDEDGQVIFDSSIAAAASGEALHDQADTLETIDRFDAEYSVEDTPSSLYEDALREFEQSEAVPVASDEPESGSVEADMGTALEDFSFDAPTDQALQDSLEIEIGSSVPAVDVSETTSDEGVADTMPVGQEPGFLHRRVNLGEIRMDVARITSDIQSGERLYQRAQQRVESLMGFVERAEVDFSLLNRLEPENRRLKARNRVLEAENEAGSHGLRRLESELEDAREQRDEARADLEAAQAKLRALTSHLAKREDELKTLTAEMEESALRMERTQTSVEVESRENIILRDQIATLSTRIDDVTAERMELAKIVESLKIDCEDFRAQKDQATSEVSDLRAALATAQKVNGEMKTRMVALHDEIKGFKTQYEFNVISRDDRIINLESRVADLTKQLRIKEDVTKSALSDVAQLRKSRSAQDVERERLERVIESQQRQLDEANLQINRSTASMAELDQRYNDVAAALSIHQKRVTPSGLAAPLADPPPFDIDSPSNDGRPRSGSRAPVKDRSDETLTPENVEDLIMDYKLGLRDRIA